MPSAESTARPRRNVLSQRSATAPVLHSFPTRRSSDLDARVEQDEPERHLARRRQREERRQDRKSTRLNSSQQIISYAVFCLKTKTKVTNKTDDEIQKP